MWSIGKRRHKALSVTGALIQSCITNILLDVHLLVLALKHLLIPDYYIGIWRERICIASAVFQFIALTTLPWFHTVQMRSM